MRSIAGFAKDVMENLLANLLKNLLASRAILASEALASIDCLSIGRWRLTEVSWMASVGLFLNISLLPVERCRGER